MKKIFIVFLIFGIHSFIFCSYNNNNKGSVLSEKEQNLQYEKARRDELKETIDRYHSFSASCNRLLESFRIISTSDNTAESANRALNGLRLMEYDMVVSGQGKSLGWILLEKGNIEGFECWVTRGGLGLTPAKDEFNNPIYDDNNILNHYLSAISNNNQNSIHVVNTILNRNPKLLEYLQGRFNITIRTLYRNHQLSKSLRDEIIQALQIIEKLNKNS